MDCPTIRYASHRQRIKQGEGRINGQFIGGSEISGGEFQGALAVSNHVGLILNTAFVGSSGEDWLSNGKDKGHGSLIEGGAGYYLPIQKRWVFETYGGAGVGGATNEYSSGGDSKVNFTKFFLQPSFGYTSNNFEVGAASKFSWINMNVEHSNINISNDPYNFGMYEQMNIDYIKSDPTSVLWEPSFFVRFGFQIVKMQLQYTHSVNLNNKLLSQEPGVFSAGISIAIKPHL